MALFSFDLQQGTAEWYAIRSGIPTASCAHLVLTPKKLELATGRRKYACRLIAERLLRWQADNLDTIGHIADGKANEPFAIAQLEEINGIETEPVGFVRTNDGRFGASPDRVAGVNADRTGVDVVVEAKCPTIPVQLERLIFGAGDEYLLQVQMQLWVAEADKAIFYSWTSRTPAYQVETGRNEAVIGKLRDALEQFSDELDIWTEKVKRAGSFQPFAELVTPVEEAARAYADSDNLADRIIETGNWGG
jgi:YqaJ-like viral recombinase domain